MSLKKTGKKKSESKDSDKMFILCQDEDKLYIVKKNYLHKLSRQHALNIGALTWLEMHRLLKEDAIEGDALYIGTKSNEIKAVDGLLNSLDELDTIHPMIVKQIQSMDLMRSGLRVHRC